MIQSSIPSPNVWPEVLRKLYEITTFFVIAIFAVLVTVYAITISITNNIIQWIKKEKEKLNVLADRAENEIQEKITSLQKNPKKGQDAISELNTTWQRYQKEKTDKEIKFNKCEATLSWKGIILYPGIAIICGLFLSIISYIFINIFTPYPWISLISYGACLLLLAWAIWRIASVLRETSRLSREIFPAKEEPKEKPPTKTKGKEKEVLEKTLTELKKLLGLKKPDFTVKFIVDNNIMHFLNLKKGEDKEVKIQIGNGSQFAAQETTIELALPQGFVLRNKLTDNPLFRSSTVTFYPRGASLTIEKGIFPSRTIYTQSIFIRGDNLGDYLIYLWIHSITHEIYENKFKVSVTE